MVFCTEFLDGWCLESHCVGRVYGADGAARHVRKMHGQTILELRY